MSDEQELGGGVQKPQALREDQLYVQQDSAEDKIRGVWGGDKNGLAKVIQPMKVVFPGDGEDYSMKPTDRHVGADTTTSGATITLPAVTNSDGNPEIEDGHRVTIEDHGGNATNNNITIETPDSETVETGSISTNDGIVHLMWDKENTNWKDVG